MAENPNENSAILQGRAEAVREKAARLLGAAPDEIAILHNCTEGNNLVAQGIDLKVLHASDAKCKYDANNVNVGFEVMYGGPLNAKLQSLPPPGSFWLGTPSIHRARA